MTMGQETYITETQGQAKIHTLTWCISKYLHLFEKKATRELRTTSTTDSKFQIKMQFLGLNYDLIELYYLYSAPLFLKAIVSVCLSGYEERSIATKDYHSIQAKKWQYMTTLYKRDIGATNGAFILENGSLCLKFQFFVKSDVKVQHNSNVPETQLSKDLESLLSEGLYSDVTIKSCDGTSFNVHKAILASRSAVLKAHFEHNTTECHTNIIESALETEVLREVINFIYCDQSRKLNVMPDKLLAAAEYYQLTRLKSLCEEALHKKLTVENAVKTLHLADLHSAPNLKRLTLEYIKDGQARLITKTSGWTTLQSLDLIKSIYECVVEEDTK